jgi:hypothetical protein
VRIPQPLNIDGSRSERATRCARSADAMPVSNTCPEFDETTRQGSLSPSSARAYTESSSHQKRFSKS